MTFLYFIMLTAFCAFCIFLGTLSGFLLGARFLRSISNYGHE